MHERLDAAGAAIVELGYEPVGFSSSAAALRARVSARTTIGC